MIALSRLQAICKTEAGKAAVVAYSPYLDKYMPQFGIGTQKRIAPFLANLAHESGDFTRIRENLNYSANGLAATWPGRFRGSDGKPNAKALSLHRKPEAIANCVYADRLGNGNEASGDGWKYRGVGLIQLTGADNLRACGQVIGLDLVAHPELLEIPDNAVKAACWFWQANGINTYADAGDFDGVCDEINRGKKTKAIGDSIGYAERLEYLRRAEKALGMVMA